MRRCGFLRQYSTGGSSGGGGVAAIRSWKWQPKPDLSQAEKFRLHEAQERENRAAAGNRTHTYITNPIAERYDGELKIGKSKYGKLQAESWTEYAAHQEDLAKWMTARQAATILEIPENKLYGLRQEEVEDAWSRAYPKASTETQRHEVNGAAEHLVEYARSHFAQERTKDHFTETIMKTKKEVAQAVDKNNEWSRNMLYNGLGIGHFIITAGFTASIVLMYRYIEKNDAELAVFKAKRHFQHATAAVVNEEPAPEYQTRYRDTPTTLDERLAQPHPEITDPRHRDVLLKAEAAQKKEEVLLSNLTSDVKAEAAARQRDREHREQLKVQLANVNALDMMDAMVKAVPPPALRDLRKA